MIEKMMKEKPWVLVEYAQFIVRPLSMVGLLLGIIALVGYASGIETFYRPITNDPATNPLTAICIIFIGFGLCFRIEHTYGQWLQRLGALAIFTIAAVVIIDKITGLNLTASVTPFHQQVLIDLQDGKNNSMGVNSATMFLLIALSLLASSFKRLNSSQLLAFIAIGIPTTSFTGYVYGLDNFYGQMSPLTTMTGFLLAMAALLVSANSGAVKAMLSPYVGGKTARLQTAVGYIFPTALGYLLVKSLDSSQGNVFGLFVVTISWFIILMVCVSAVAHEAIDLKRRRMERILAQSAMNDHLTGLPNRRRFFSFGQRELNRLQRTKSQLWLLMLDIDHFKKVNDTAGHEMGDKILVEISQVLTQSVRAVDLVSRIGGEEFSIILVDCTRQGAVRVSESIRSRIEKTHIAGWTEHHGAVTVSIGCAVNEGDYTLEETLKVADGALYRAKENGRNQICISETPYVTNLP